MCSHSHFGSRESEFWNLLKIFPLGNLDRKYCVCTSSKATDLQSWQTFETFTSALFKLVGIKGTGIRFDGSMVIRSISPTHREAEWSLYTSLNAARRAYISADIVRESTSLM